jgi:hypothetical protein
MSEISLSKKTRIFSLTANTVAQRICADNPTRKGLKVQITDGYTAYIINAQNKPYTEGMKVTSSLPYENTTTTDAMWIITSSGTAACIIQEDTD